ncbi:MAG: leucine-rich repeat domain-containing protein, partial [Clostridia bacterium]
AFYECYGLTSIIIPSSVKSIDHYAFFNCTGLTTIIIPNSVTNIGNKVFFYCGNLTTINCEATAQPVGWDAGWKTECNATVVWGYVAA